MASALRIPVDVGRVTHRDEGHFALARRLDQLQGHLDAVGVGLVEDQLARAVQAMFGVQRLGGGRIGNLFHADDNVHAHQSTSSLLFGTAHGADRERRAKGTSSVISAPDAQLEHSLDVPVDVGRPDVHFDAQSSPRSTATSRLTREKGKCADVSRWRSTWSSTAAPSSTRRRASRPRLSGETRRTSCTVASAKLDTRHCARRRRASRNARHLPRHRRRCTEPNELILSRRSPASRPAAVQHLGQRRNVARVPSSPGSRRRSTGPPRCGHGSRSGLCRA